MEIAGECRKDCTGVASRSGGTATKCSADAAVDAGGVRVKPFEGGGRVRGFGARRRGWCCTEASFH